MKRLKMTRALRATLGAVKEGRVFRAYDARGNRIIGAHASSVLKLESAGLVREHRDMRPSAGMLSIRILMEPTERGQTI